MYKKKLAGKWIGTVALEVVFLATDTCTVLPLLTAMGYFREFNFH